MTRPTQNRLNRETWGIVLLAGLALVVAALLILAVLQPGRTAADERASAAAVQQMDRAQARDTAARREAEKSRRSEFD